MTPCQLAWPFCCHLFNIHFTAFFLSPLPHMFAGGILARKRSERDLHKERGGQHKGFSRQTNGRLDRSTTATGHTLALTHTHLHTSPIRPDDCLGARWHSTSLSLFLAFFSPLSAQSVPKTKTQFAVCYFTAHTQPPPARLRLASSVLASRLDRALILCCRHILGAITNRPNLILA